MSQIPNLKHFQEKLESEAKTLEEDLGKIARHNPKNPADWEIKPADEKEEDAAFRDEVADQLEAFNERVEIEINLEKRLRHIKLALTKIQNGEYGKCEICNKLIETDRLETNPAAKTCKEHLGTDDQLY